MKKNVFFPGCNISFIVPEIEQSIRKTFELIKFDIYDLQGASCCPTWGTVPSFDKNTWLTISARNISIAEQMNSDIITGCNSCFSILNKTRNLLIDNKLLFKEINKRLNSINKQFIGTSEIFHITHILSNNILINSIKEKIVQNLNKVIIAVQPGCHLLWPANEIKIREKNSFFPDNLIQLCICLGANAPHYSKISSCCGAGALQNIDQEKSFIILKEKLLSMKHEINPHIIVTGCSSCYIQLQRSQAILRKQNHINFEIPVFYYTQLLCLCMGIKLVFLNEHQNKFVNNFFNI